MFEDVKRYVDSGNLNKAEYHDILKNYDKGLRDMLNSLNYKYDNTRFINLFGVSEDQRLEEAIKKYEKMNTHPEFTVSEYVKHIYKIFYDFLEVYKIGWCRKFEINSYGTVNIELICSMHSKTVSSNPVTDKEKFENQMNFLRDQGFEIVKSSIGGDNVFPSTENNRKLLYNLLESRGALIFYMNERKGEIHEINLKINHKNLFNFFIEKEVVIEDTNKDILNKDEIVRVCKLINSLNDVINYLKISNSSMISTCGSIIESEFAELCEIFNFNSEIKKIVDERHEDARNKNMKIREIESNMGANFPIELVDEALKKVFSKFNEFVVSNIGFDCRDAFIDQYGLFNAKLFSSPCIYWGDYEIVDEKELSKSLQTIGSRDSDDFYIIDSTNNKEVLLNILSNNIPSISIRDINVGMYNNFFVIKEMNVLIRNLMDVF